LEKPGSYTLGDPNQSLTEEHLTRAARAMLLNTVFFLFLVVIPVMMTVRMAGLQIG